MFRRPAEMRLGCFPSTRQFKLDAKLHVRPRRSSGQCYGILSPARAREARSPMERPFDLARLRKAPARRACAALKSLTSRSGSDRLAIMPSSRTPRSDSLATISEGSPSRCRRRKKGARRSGRHILPASPPATQRRRAHSEPHSCSDASLRSAINSPDKLTPARISVRKHACAQLSALCAARPCDDAQQPANAKRSLPTKCP